MDAASTINLGGAFNVAPGQTFNVRASNPSALGTVNADGPTKIAGTMNVDANLTLGSVSGRYSTLDITNGGHLTLGGDATGGTIAITSGTLEFSQIGFEATRLNRGNCQHRSPQDLPGHPRRATEQALLRLGLYIGFVVAGVLLALMDGL